MKTIKFIIAITTAKKGLDVSHTGIAIRLADGSLHFLHAPDVGATVTVSKETLPEYLKHHPEQTGIMVLRVHSPEKSFTDQSISKFIAVSKLY